jgi:hypothetical protein
VKGGIHHRRESKCCWYKELSEELLLLLSGGSAGTIDGLLNLASKTILGSVELRANGTILGERSTDLFWCY